MPTYAISYKLVGDDERTESRAAFLADRIRTLFASYCRPLESVWLVTSDESVAYVRDHLVPYLSPDDRLAVFLVGGAGAWHGLAAEDGMWLHDHL